MANHHRGEIDCVIGDRRLRLCLTLGALAEIEAAFGVDGLAALGRRLSTGGVAMRDVIAILGAAARGAGETIDDDELRALPLGDRLPALVAAVMRLLELTFSAEPNPPRP